MTKIFLPLKDFPVKITEKSLVSHYPYFVVQLSCSYHRRLHLTKGIDAAQVIDDQDLTNTTSRVAKIWIYNIF